MKKISEDEEYQSWRKGTLQALDIIDFGLVTMGSNLENIYENILIFKSKISSFEKTINRLDSAEQFFQPGSEIQSNFQNIKNDLSRSSLHIIELSHDIELAVTLNYLVQKIGSNKIFLDPIEKTLEGITLRIRQDGSVKIFPRPENSSNSCHIIGIDEFGIEIQLSISYKFRYNGIDFQETSSPTLNLTLTTTPINEQKIQLLLTRGARLCNKGKSFQKFFDQIFFLSLPQKEEYRVRLENEIVAKANSNFPQEIDIDNIPSNQLIPSTNIYNSHVQDHVRFFIQSKKRTRKKHEFVQDIPNWVDIVLSLKEDIIIDLISQKIKDYELKLVGFKIILSSKNSIEFTVKKEFSESKKLKIIDLPGDFLDVTVLVGVKVDVVVKFNLILKVTEDRKISYNIVQIGDVIPGDPQVKPIDVTDIPIVGDFIDEVIQDATKIFAQIMLLLTGTIYDEFDIFPNSERLELSLQSDRLVILSQGKILGD